MNPVEMESYIDIASEDGLPPTGRALFVPEAESCPLSCLGGSVGFVEAGFNAAAGLVGALRPGAGPNTVRLRLSGTPLLSPGCRL